MSVAAAADDKPLILEEQVQPLILEEQVQWQQKWDEVFKDRKMNPIVRNEKAEQQLQEWKAKAGMSVEGKATVRTMEVKEVAGKKTITLGLLVRAPKPGKSIVTVKGTFGKKGEIRPWSLEDVTITEVTTP
jgi:hypothetical protein